MPGRNAFSEAERAAVYRAIFERRDVRSQFRPDPIPDDVLARLLKAAHHAPSVGFMQPWRFIIVRDRARREAVHALFSRANAAAGQSYTDADTRSSYASLKLAGILDTPLNLCIVCDADSSRGRGLGRATMPEMSLYSTVCAVQNLWLAARAEGVGVGWVSIVEPDELCRTLEVPEHLRLIAYLCVGYVSHFEDQPELATRRWETRADLSELLHFDSFGEQDGQRARALLDAGRPEGSGNRTSR